MDEEEEIEETTPPVVNGTPEKDDLKEAEDKKYNKILTWILILSFVGIVGVLSFYMFNQSLNKFNDGDLIMTSLKMENYLFIIPLLLFMITQKKSIIMFILERTQENFKK